MSKQYEHLEWYKGYKAGMFQTHMSGSVDAMIKSPETFYQKGFSAGYYAGQAIRERAYSQGIDEGYLRGKEFMYGLVQENIAELRYLTEE